MPEEIIQVHTCLIGSSAQTFRIFCQDFLWPTTESQSQSNEPAAP